MQKYKLLTDKRSCLFTGVHRVNVNT